MHEKIEVYVLGRLICCTSAVGLRPDAEVQILEPEWKPYWVKPFATSCAGLRSTGPKL